MIYIDERERDSRKLTLRLLDIETGETKFLSSLIGNASWSSDDRHVIVNGRKTLADGPTETWRIEVADPSKKTRLPIAETDMVMDWSPDDKTLLVLKGKNEKGEIIARSTQRPLHLVDLEGKDLGRVLASSPMRRFWVYHFTPDGKRIVFLRSDLTKKENEYRTVGLDGKDERRS